MRTDVFVVFYVMYSEVVMYDSTSKNEESVDRGVGSCAQCCGKYYVGYLQNSIVLFVVY